MLFRKTRSERIIESPWVMLGCGALAGVLGTLAMGPVGNALYELEGEEKKKREEALRKEMPFETLAGRLIELGGGVDLNDLQKYFQNLALPMPNIESV